MIEPIRENAPVKETLVGDRSGLQDELMMIEPI